MYPSCKISTTALNDLLKNKVISTECLCCDYHLGLYSVEMIWSTVLYCFLLVSFCDWIQTFFKLGGENQGVFNYGAIWGWLCYVLVVVPLFFPQKCGGEDGLLLINRLWRWRSNLISHFNINAIGSLKSFIWTYTKYFSFNLEEVQR